MSRPVWAAGLLLVALALPGPAFAGTAKPPLPSTDLLSPPAVPKAAVLDSTAVAVARSLFPAELVKETPTTELGPSDLTGQTVWRIAWQGESGTIQVEVDAADGQVVMANRWDQLPRVPGARLTNEQAAATANAWLGRLAPSVKSSLMPAKQIYPAMPDPTAFTFNYDFYAQGYPVPSSRAFLRFASDTGELLGWQLERPQGSMLMPPAILSADEAVAAFSKLPLPLQYMQAYWANSYPNVKMPEAGESPKIILAYQPPRGYALSQSGVWLDAMGQPIPDVSIPAWRQVPPPPMPYKPPTEPLTRDQALVIARAVTGQTREPDSYSANRYSGHMSYSFGWVDWAADPGTETHVQVDAEAGVVNEFWTGAPKGPVVEIKVTQAEALDAAIAFIQHFRPDVAESLLYPTVSPEAGSPGIFTFQFVRQYKGIPIQDNGLTVQVDGTGQVVQFWGNVTPSGLVLPEPQVLAPGPLLAKLVAISGVELGWIHTTTKDGGGAYQLVWHLGNAVPIQLIEAQTGIFRDYDGTDVLRLRLPPTDIAGHWAEKEVQALFEQRIITVESGQFQPDQPMTQAEAATWLARLSVGGPYPYAADPASTDQIAVGEPNPSTPITREAFARMVVVALGYDRIADMRNQIWMPFLDQGQIDPGARNAVAVLNGLGVVRGTPEGYFLPKKALTRAEAARILFQSLEFRRVTGYK